MAEPDPASPICPHFGNCGGCSLQHLAWKNYLKTKADAVRDAFRAIGLDIEPDQIAQSPLHSRRRVTFTAHRVGADVLLGYQQRRSHDIVDISACPIARPEIVDALPMLRDLAGTLLQGVTKAQFAITACDNGLDLNVAVEREPQINIMADAVRLLSRSVFLRAALNGEVIFDRERPLVSFGQAEVTPPPGGFLQATQEAEVAMAELVCGHLKNAKRVADLFSGSGTFSLRLARRSRVHAVEQSNLALKALSEATRAEGLKPVTVERRDLDALPLMASELARFDGICLDPPRAGARAQVAEIAKTSISRIGYVSCNPQTLARDAMRLVDAGYRLERLIPVDQFVYSNHVEALALFSKAKASARRSIFR
ncbi:MAG: RsmD family RNA methyltransferase [Ahrensia sp.]|nr:RsmD family RNA methyltransferase [Ahrensia sp.]